MTEFDIESLPALEEWRSAFVPPVSVRSYLGEHTDVTATAIVAELLLPTFVEERDGVFVAAPHTG